MDIINKSLGQYAVVDVALANGGLVASVTVPVGALLDEGAAKLKAALPSTLSAELIDLVVNELKVVLSK